jgi:hypothetical protein
MIEPLNTSMSDRVSDQYLEVIRSEWGFGTAVLEPVREDEFIIGESLPSTAFANDVDLRCLTPEYTGELVFPTSVDFNRQ